MIRYGGAAPVDLVILQLSAAWHIPPWEVEDHDDGQYWAARWALYQDELAKAKQPSPQPSK